MLTLRPATMEDAADLFAWRNDPLTRAMFVNTDEVTWEEHVAWLEGSLGRDDRVLVIAELDGAPVGTVRLDYENGAAEMSITVSPAHRGGRFSRDMVLAALPDCACMARIKRHNLAAQRLIASAGFCLLRGGNIQLWRHPGHAGSDPRRLLPPNPAVPPARAVRAAQALAMETLSPAASG